MLPDLLRDTYKQYKADTTEFLTWLVNSTTAGLATTSVETKSKGPRLKGKARKAAKTDTTPKTFSIGVKQILQLAQGVVETSKDIPKVPRRMLRLLQKTITLRKRCALWYDSEAATGARQQESLQGHAHFIDILEKTLHLLLQTSNSESLHSIKQNQSDEYAKPARRSNQANTFASLPVEYASSDDEISRNGEGDEVDNECTPPLNEKATKACEEEVPEEEIVFATFCMLEDMERLRMFIKETWQKYKDHALTLINASTCTNTAIQFARGIEENFQRSFPRYANWPEVIDAIFPILVERCGFGSDPTEAETHDKLERLYWGPLLSIYKFAHMKVRVPVINEFYDPSVDYFTLSVAKRRRRDRILSNHFLWESLSVVKRSLPTKDELSLGLSAAVEAATIGEPRVNLWLVFALRILLDINHILGKLRQD